MIIKNIFPEDHNEAISIFSEAFTDDPLFKFAFPEDNIRYDQTGIMYSFVVNDMVPVLKLKLVGSYENNELSGCMIYATPESFHWNEDMNTAVEKMRVASGDERISLIGEYATLSGFDPKVPNFYGNELAVKKEFRNRGIGKTLCKYLIDQCEQSPSAKGILLDTANSANISIYEKLGWELKKSVPFYDIKKHFLWRFRTTKLSM
jgi:ribosomal protein S18 acetylase RimI-like enzyme